MKRGILLVLATLFPLQLAAETWLVDPDRQRAAYEKLVTELGGKWVAGTAPGGAIITTLTGRPLHPSGVPLEARVAAVFQQAVTLRESDPRDFLPPVRETLEDVDQFRFQQVRGDRPVRNAYIVVNVDRETGLFDVILNNTPAGLPIEQAVRLPADAAEIAKRVILGEAVREGLATVAELERATVETTVRGEAGALPELLSFGWRLASVYHVTARLVVPRDGLPATVAWREYDIDASLAEGLPAEAYVVRSETRIDHAAPGKGLVFMPNPATALNDNALRIDTVPKTQPPYREVNLRRLDPARDGKFFLSGALARIAQRAGPDGCCPAVGGTPPDFRGFRDDDKFAAVNAYFHVDAMQSHVEDLGLGRLRIVPLDIDVNIANRRFLATFTRPAPLKPAFLGFSIDLGGKALAEDGDLVAHEYAHSLMFMAAQGRFSIGRDAKNAAPEALPINEGFCDYWAISTFADANPRDHAMTCFTEWAHIDPCFRTIDQKNSYRQFDADLPADVNGGIWSSVLFRIFTVLRQNRTAADKLILLGQMRRMLAGDGPTMKEMAEGILLADRGRHKGELCGVFRRFEIGPLACCGEGVCE